MLKKENQICILHHQNLLQRDFEGKNKTLKILQIPYVKQLHPLSVCTGAGNCYVTKYSFSIFLTLQTII